MPQKKSAPKSSKKPTSKTKPEIKKTASKKKPEVKKFDNKKDRDANDQRFKVATFGKHKGERWADIMENDKGYAKWAKTLDSPGGGLKNFQSYASRNTSNAAVGKKIIGFGHHEGKSYKQVMEDDPSWCRWALNQKKQRKASKPLYEVACYLEQIGFQ